MWVDANSKEEALQMYLENFKTENDPYCMFEVDPTDLKRDLSIQDLEKIATEIVTPELPNKNYGEFLTSLCNTWLNADDDNRKYLNDALLYIFLKKNVELILEKWQTSLVVKL